MSRFRPLSEIQTNVTTCNQRNPESGYTKNFDKGIKISRLSCSDTKCNRVTSVTTFFSRELKEYSRSGALATSKCFRAKMRKAARHLPVELSLVFAEFANDAEDIEQGVYSDDALRKAVCSFMVAKLGVYPQEVRERTPADDGMVRCRACAHWWQRCRHPSLHNGRWAWFDPKLWRRCVGFKSR